MRAIRVAMVMLALVGSAVGDDRHASIIPVSTVVGVVTYQRAEGPELRGTYSLELAAPLSAVLRDGGPEVKVSTYLLAVTRLETERFFAANQGRQIVVAGVEGVRGGKVFLTVVAAYAAPIKK